MEVTSGTRRRRRRSLARATVAFCFCIFASILPTTFGWSMRRHPVMSGRQSQKQQQQGRSAWPLFQSSLAIDAPSTEPIEAMHRTKTSDLPTRTKLPSTKAIPQSERRIRNAKNERVAPSSIGQMKRLKGDTYQWLTWFHNQFTEVGGGVDSGVLKKVLAAMDGYAKERNTRSAEHAEALLSCYIDEVERLHAAVTPSSTSPTVTSPILNVTIFNSAMNAYAQIGDPIGAQRVLKRLTQLQKSDAQHSRSLQPDSVTFTTLASAWVKSRRPDAAARAESVLAHVEEHCSFTPTTYLYNVVLSAWSESNNDTEKIGRAESIVKRMLQASVNSTDAKPDLYTYQTLISVYSKSRIANAPAKTERILRWLETQSSTDDTLQPNVHCYTAVMRAYAYSSTCQGKAQKAYDLLLELQRRHEVQGMRQCRPNVVAFTSAINACIKPAHESERYQSFWIAKTVLESLMESPQYGTANYLTYATYLQAIATTLDAGSIVRDNECRRVFRQCCAAGQVGAIVLDKLRRTASSDLLDELLEAAKTNNQAGEQVTYESLPLAWTINVRGERRGQKKGRL